MDPAREQYTKSSGGTGKASGSLQEARPAPSTKETCESGRREGARRMRAQASEALREQESRRKWEADCLE
ncbi:MAG: hypothetical protein LBU32_09215 [Clostridiales bacterium]|jgi:hypothetical protein|nr:hypothetical protein [Clostridiales bacterium]